MLNLSLIRLMFQKIVKVN